MKERILNLMKENPLLSSKEIHEVVATEVSYATVKRILTQLISDQLIVSKGEGKARKYALAPYYELFHPMDITKYFEKEIDERIIKKSFNHDLIPELINSVSIFTNEELQKLTVLQQTFKSNVGELSEQEYQKELERLAIDLSWKSSQIEGNTYSLLETERLLKDKETAQGKTKDDAVMLLNHKEAIDFVVANPDYINPLTTAKIEVIHSLLIKELGVERNIRKRRVGISGTNYNPLDNEHQIYESLTNMCQLINKRNSIFEKSFLVLLFISYIQPFGDGNKRTARIISNAILIGNHHCPISFRTIDSIEYKKAMLLFSEQNNLSTMKAIFIDQFDFAVKTYF